MTICYLCSQLNDINPLVAPSSKVGMDFKKTVVDTKRPVLGQDWHSS